MYIMSSVMVHCLQRVIKIILCTVHVQMVGCVVYARTCMFHALCMCRHLQWYMVYDEYSHFHNDCLFLA